MLDYNEPPCFSLFESEITGLKLMRAKLPENRDSLKTRANLEAPLTEIWVSTRPLEQTHIYIRAGSCECRVHQM